MIKDKSLTFADSLRTSTTDIVNNITRNTPLLNALGNTPLPSKFTHIPTLPIPAALATGVDSASVELGELVVTKGLLSVDADITDETIEDATVAVTGSVQATLEYLVSLRLEQLLIEKLIADVPSISVPTATSTRDLVISAIKEFDPTLYLLGKGLLVVVSADDHLDLTLQDNPVTDLPFVTLIASPFMTNNKVAIIPARGAAVGYGLKGIEQERVAGGVGVTKYIAQGTFGASFSPDYVKVRTI